MKRHENRTEPLACMLKSAGEGGNAKGLWRHFVKKVGVFFVLSFLFKFEDLETQIRQAEGKIPTV